MDINTLIHGYRSSTSKIISRETLSELIRVFTVKVVTVMAQAIEKVVALLDLLQETDYFVTDLSQLCKLLEKKIRKFKGIIKQVPRMRVISV